MTTAKPNIFVVLAALNPIGLEGQIAATYPTDHLKVGDGEWLIASVGTAKDVSDKLGVTNGTPSNGIVVSISGYYGRQQSNVWEWIRTKWEGGPHGG
jgi:hypothetical protein